MSYFQLRFSCRGMYQNFSVEELSSRLSFSMKPLGTGLWPQIVWGQVLSNTVDIWQRSRSGYCNSVYVWTCLLIGVVISNVCSHTLGYRHALGVGVTHLQALLHTMLEYNTERLSCTDHLL